MTRFNNKYPYTDFHELNADWLLETVKDAADTVDGYDGRLTSAEGAINTLQSEVETPGTGLLDRMEDAEDKIGTLTIEVETPSTGLLDRMTAAEGKIAEHDGDIDNIEGRMVTYDQNFIDINNQFISDQGRIRDLENYRTEAQVKIGNLGYSIAPLFDEDSGYNAGDYVMSPTLKLHRAIVDVPAGTANINDLTQFRPTDINNALDEGALPLVTSADAGDVLTVDNNGDWVAATPIGGIFKISLQGPPPSPTGINKTHAEILDALSKGLLPVILDHSIGRTYYFDSVSQPLAGSPIYFKCISITSSAIHNYRISITSANAFSLTDIVYAP